MATLLVALLAEGRRVRAITGRVERDSAAPRPASSTPTAPKPSGTIAISSRTASMPARCQSAASTGSSQQPVARSETPL